MKLKCAYTLLRKILTNIGYKVYRRTQNDLRGFEEALCLHNTVNRKYMYSNKETQKFRLKFPSALLVLLFTHQMGV